MPGLIGRNMKLATGGRRPRSAASPVLDAGSGAGYGSMMLADAGAARVDGIDLSDEAVADARLRAGPSVEFTVGDVRDLPFPADTFDVVVCFEAIEHVEGREAALDEFVRVLRAGGLLILSSPNRDVYPPGNPHHVYEYTPAELSSELGARFRHVQLWRQKPWLASLILDDTDSASRSTDTELTVQSTKIAAAEPGDEVYTLAVASDGALPRMHGAADLRATSRSSARPEERRISSRAYAQWSKR